MHVLKQRVGRMQCSYFCCCCVRSHASAQVPAGMTWLLQPCDTHLFRKFKAALRKRWVQHRASSLAPNVGLKDWVSIISGAIVEVLPANAWRGAFKHAGLLDGQRDLGSSVQQKLGLEGRVDVAASKPSTEELKVLFPQNVKVQSLSLFPPEAAPKAKAAAKPKAASKVAPGPSSSISSHTRSKVKL